MNDTMVLEEQRQQLAGVKSSLYVLQKALRQAQKQYGQLETGIAAAEKQLFYDTLMQYGLQEEEILQIVQQAAQKNDPV